ncbi:MAG: phosphoesterase [Planctomycetota bacterium]
MSAVAEEKVLVVPTAVFHQLGHFQGFCDDAPRYLEGLLGCGQLGYRPRGEMEQDPGYKQLIPYAVFRYVGADGVTRVFNYRRGGGVGEQRLRAKRSVGVGGHISTLDAGADTSVGATTGAADSSAEVYRRGLERELAEEVAIDTPFRERCIGLINDDETDVGRVHLGFVHAYDVERPAVSPREEDIQDTGFAPLQDIAAAIDGYESWSQIVVRALVESAG